MRKITITDNEAAFIVRHAEERISQATHVLQPHYQAQFFKGMSQSEIEQVEYERHQEINELKTLLKKVRGQA